MAERDRCRESQDANGTTAHGGGFVSGLREFVEKRLDPGKIKGPGFGGCEMPGRALKQARPNLSLKLRHGARD